MIDEASMTRVGHFPSTYFFIIQQEELSALLASAL